MKAWFVRCLLCATALGVCLSHAHAVTRCEDSSGKVTYVDGACPSGSTAVRNVANPATAPVTEQTTAVNRASQEYKDAERMRIAREKQERKDQKEAKARAKAAQHTEKKSEDCKELALRLKHKREDFNDAPTHPAAMKHKKRALESAERNYARRCKK